jgi:hypothetical protein
MWDETRSNFIIKEQRVSDNFQQRESEKAWRQNTWKFEVMFCWTVGDMMYRSSSGRCTWLSHCHRNHAPGLLQMFRKFGQPRQHEAPSQPLLISPGLNISSMKQFYLTFKISLSVSHKTHPTLIAKNNRLLPFRKVTVGYYEKHMAHVGTL